jgi:hypothetical protein
MQWTFRFRAVGRPRRTRRADAAVGSPLGQPRRPNAAMAGLEVSPVHGRHCICERCERQSSSAA